MYGAASQTLKCYAQRNGYRLFLVDLTNDQNVVKRCAAYSDHVR